MNKKIILGIMIVGIIFGSVGVYAGSNFYANGISVNAPTPSSLGSDANLQNSLDELYSIADKQFILSILEKTLKVINEGGIPKKDVNSQTELKENVRTVSGTFLYLIKQSDVLSKKDIKRIFWRNNAKKKEKKKFTNKFDKLNI